MICIPSVKRPAAAARRTAAAGDGGGPALCRRGRGEPFPHAASPGGDGPWAVKGDAVTWKDVVVDTAEARPRISGRVPEKVQ